MRVALLAGVCLVAAVDRDQHRRQLLDDPRHLQRPGIDGAQAGDQLDQAGDPGLVDLLVAADEDVLSQLGIGVGEGRGADRVQGGDDGDPVGHHLLSLLRGGALPDAERAGRFAAHRGGQRHRAVDQDLSGLQSLAQVVEVLRLGPEGDGEEDDLALLRRLAVLEPGDVGAGHRRADLRGCLLGALGRARAEHDRGASPSPAGGQAGAKGTGAANDRYRCELRQDRASLCSGRAARPNVTVRFPVSEQSTNLVSA